jgi:hypothetical protein
MELEAIMNTEM